MQDTHNVFQKLTEFTNFNNFEILYDSDIHPLNVTFFQRCLYGRRDVIVLLVSKTDYIYGSFNGSILGQVPINKMENSNNDPKHFIFSLKSDHIPPTKWVKKSLNINSSSICFTSEEAKMYIFIENKAFGFWNPYLYNEESLYFYFGITGEFENGPSHFQLIGKEQSRSINNSYEQAKRVLILQCYD
ncbi:TLDc domain-containing protein [Entamoeba marina]